MIFDGAQSFPDSVVKYTRFDNHETRYLFARMRELELVLQEDVARLGKNGRKEKVLKWIEQAGKSEDFQLLCKLIRLHNVESTLIWMVTNVTGSAEEKALRRRGFGSDEHVRGSKQIVVTDRKSFHGLLDKFFNG